MKATQLKYVNILYSTHYTVNLLFIAITFSIEVSLKFEAMQSKRSSNL